MALSAIHVLIGGMINLIGQLGAELITYAVKVIRELLSKTFGEETVKYADIIVILISIIIIYLILYYIFDAVQRHKRL